MKTFLERYQAGDLVGVWKDLTALGDGVRHELYYADAAAVAAETMRRARHNVEELIRRLHARGYRFQDQVARAEDRVAQIDVLGQLAAHVQARAGGNLNVQTLQLLENFRNMQSKMAPLVAQAGAKAAKAASAKPKPPLEDPQVFSPPDRQTGRQIAQLEKAAGGPLPLSLRAWYEQVGGVSLVGSHPVLNDVDFSNRGVVGQFALASSPPPSAAGFAPDPLVILPLSELLEQVEEEDDSGEDLQIVISPDDLHKANVSGDAYYLKLPNAGADFTFDDWHHNTFVNYLRSTFSWGGFPGWERADNPPRKELAELSYGLLPL